MGDRIVPREEWLPARLTLLAREKELSRLRDAVNAERLALPRVRIDKDYRFETPEGPASLADLFDGRSQLVVYHFMFAPGWEEGCPGCSFMADHLDGPLAHLNNHDVTLVVVSQAPLAKLEAYKRRMGWRFPWVSSFGSDFNADFGVSFTAEELARGGGPTTTPRSARAKAWRSCTAKTPSCATRAGRSSTPTPPMRGRRRSGVDADDPRPGAEGPQRDRHAELRQTA